MTRFKFAALLIGFSISLKCSAADGSTINPAPSTLPIPVTDGKQKFSELFHLNDDYQVSYKVTTDHPPNPTLADALDKQWATVKDPPGINRRASLEAYSQRLRNGSQDAFVYTFNISKTPKLMIEKVEDDQWNNGYVTRIYFTDKNITEIEPSAGIATIYPLDPSRYPYLLINFPMLYAASGYVPDKLQMITGKAPIFTVAKKNTPVFFLLKLDSNQSLVEADEYGVSKYKIERFEIPVFVAIANMAVQYKLRFFRNRWHPFRAFKLEFIKNRKTT